MKKGNEKKGIKGREKKEEETGKGIERASIQGKKKELCSREQIKCLACHQEGNKISSLT